MKIRALSLLLLLMLGAGAAGAGEPLALISIQTESVVRGPAILLGEIAEITPGEGWRSAAGGAWTVWSDLYQALAALEIGKAALPGEQRSLYAGSVRVRLRQAGFADSMVGLHSEAAAVQVETAAASITRDEWLAELLAAARQAGLGEKVSVACATLPEKTVLLQAETPYEAKVNFGQFGIAAGQVTVAFELWNNGVVAKRITARCAINAVAEVAVAAKSLEKGAIITSDMLRWEQRDLALAPAQAITRADAELLSGKRVLANMPQGAVLTRAVVGAVPDADAGHQVRLLFSRGLVQVTDTGELMEDAWLNQPVAVLNTRTRQVLRGVLTAADAVLVD